MGGMAVSKSMCKHASCEHRIEADELLSEYDALELDAGIMLRALTAIAERRPNMPFDPWAASTAQDALWNVSERVKGLCDRA